MNKQKPPEAPRQETQAPRTPQEEPDTLQSTSYGRVIDLLCEGEIEGLVDRAGNLCITGDDFGKAIFLDETPLRNPNGKMNFAGVKMGICYGTQDQENLRGFGRGEDVIFSGQKITKDLPVTVGIINPDADHIELAVRIPALLTQDKKTGDIKGGEVSFTVSAELNASGIFDPLGDAVVIKGKASSAYLKTVAYTLPRDPDPLVSNEWVIKILRNTDDSATSNVLNDTFLDFITIVTKNKFRYPNSALVAMEIDARGFTQIPTRAFRIRGLRLRVPDNYFPATRLYNRDYLTGLPVVDGGGDPVEQIWHGGFYVAWSDNPAWCFYDLVTNKRYGLGDYIPEAFVDKFTLYSIAQYADEMIDDGFGQIEPRFRCNLYIQGREEAYKVLSDMASVFRGMIYYDGGTIVPAMDRPKPVVKTFNTANVLDGIFNYSGTGKRARHTIAIVRWNDPEDFYRPKFEYVEDAEGILKYGVRVTEIAAFGATSRGQAHRQGRWILLTELNETDSVSFKTGMDGLYLRPGDIFEVLDVNRSGNTHAGRVLAIAGDGLSMTLDREVTFGAGVNSISVARPAANLPPGAVTDSTQIAAIRTAQIVALTPTNGAGATTVVTFAAPLPAEVAVNAVWAVTTPTVSPQQFRLISAEETGPGECAIVGLEYNPSKFDAIELGLALEEPQITEIPFEPADVLFPNDLKVTRGAVVRPEGVVLKLFISWEQPPDILVERYRVEWRVVPGNWALIEETAATQSELSYTVPGTYEFRVATINRFGAMSDWATISFVVPDTNPIDAYSITGLELVGQGNDTDFVGRDARFQWRLNSPRLAEEFGAETNGAAGAGADPYFSAFEVTVWDIVSNAQVYREITTDPFWVYSYSKNSESPGGPRYTFRVEVRGLDRYNFTTAPAKLVVQNPPPSPPGNFAVFSATATVFLEWSRPPDLDLDAIEIYEHASVNDFATASKIGEVSGDTTGFARLGVIVGTTYYYWLRSRDTFGTFSARIPDGGGAMGVPSGIQGTDIADFSLKATKLFLKTVILERDVWTDNSPAAGSIAWNSHDVFYNGAKYTVPAGNTALPFVFWNPASPGAYQDFAVNPIVDPENFTIATNVNGAHDLAWLGIANAVIGTAHIFEMEVSKLSSGTITSKVIELAGGTAGIIRSLTYVAGVAGWMIDGAGNAEFNNLIARGTFAAGKIFANTELANSAYPTKTFPSVAKSTRYDVLYNAHWGTASNEYFLATPGGSLFTKAVDVRKLSTFRGPDNGAAGFDANRLAFATGNKFAVWFRGGGSWTTSGIAQLLYRTDTAAMALNDNTHPWITLDVGSWANSPNPFQMTPYYAEFEFDLPADHLVEFGIAPVNASFVGTGSTDQISEMIAMFMAFNF